MSKTPAALKAIARAKASYEADGYDVSLKEWLPHPFDGFRADAVARRDSEFVVIEFRSSDLSDGTRNRFARLAEIMESKAGWRLDIVTFEPEAPTRCPEQDDIVRRLEEARRVADLSCDAAVMLIWSSIEGALLLLSHAHGVAPSRPVPPRTLILDLNIHGILTDNQAAELDDFAKQRNQIAHGLPSNTTPSERLDWMARFALAAADNELADVDDMIEWFHQHYISPENAALFYGTEEGDYFWMGTGPHDAEDVLRGHFDLALDADIIQAVKEIEQDGYVWASNQALDSIGD